jgi:hypothetical protein
MKKVLVLVVVLIASYSFSNAQELGVRFGDVSGGAVAVDAVFSTGQFNRIHADISFGNGVGIDALWDFIYRPLGDEAFNWYVGAGPYMFIGSDFELGAVGEIGLEYRFVTIPLSLGVDYRPAFELIEHTSFHAGGFGFNVRYRFGE